MGKKKMRRCGKGMEGGARKEGKDFFFTIALLVCSWEMKSGINILTADRHYWDLANQQISYNCGIISPLQ